ncbi:MAG: hypothetical protein ABDI19_12535 [Armatimonadota bacterium]
MRRHLPSCLVVVGLLLLGAYLLSYFWLRPPHIEIPPRRYPPDNAYEYYKFLADSVWNLSRADPQLRSLLNFGSGVSTDPAKYAYLRQGYEPILREYRRHLDKPSVVVLRYDLDYRSHELAGFREIIRIERALMDYELRHGSIQQALERFDSVVRFSQQIRNEGSLIHFLTGYAQIMMVAVPVAQHLPTFDQAALERVLATCRRYEQERVPLAEVMRTEYYQGVAAFKQLREGRYHPNPVDRQTGFSKIVGIMRIPLLRDAIYASGLREYDRYMQRAIAEIEKPHWQRKPIPAPEMHGLGGKLATIMIPEFDQLARVEAIEQTRMRLLGCAAAIRLHKLRTGRYPARLEELGLGEMILDPFTGQPFHYKVDSRKGFLLYSVGTDQKDDGGWRAMEGKLERGDIGVIPYSPRRNARGSIRAVPLGAPLWLR